MSVLEAPLSAPDATGLAPGRGWARIGAASGILAAIGLFGIGMLPIDEDALIDNALVLDAIKDRELQIVLFQASTALVAIGLLVFGAGLRRHLARHEPAASLAPTLAFSGVLVTAAMLIAGGGVSTELFWQLAHDDQVDPDSIAAMLVTFNTTAYLWVGLGLTAGAVAHAALRHGSVPRWIGRVSVVAAALIGLLQLVPLQYLSVVPGLLWLITVGIGLARAEWDA